MSDLEPTDEFGPNLTQGKQGPAFENASASDETTAEPLSEDYPQLPDFAQLPQIEDHRQENQSGVEADSSPPSVRGDVYEDPGETDALIEGEPEPPIDTEEDRSLIDWDRQTSAHKIVVELKRVESEVRRLLEGRDSKRKRRLAGTRRWMELEEDVMSWRYTPRLDEDSRRRLRQLITRRHYLFRRLRFVSATRPTWNT